MLVQIVVPLLVAVAGVLLYALAANPKLAEIGRILFAVGAFWTLAIVSSAKFAL